MEHRHVLWCYFALCLVAPIHARTTLSFVLGQSACHSYPCAYMGKGFYGMQAAFLEHADSGADPTIAVELLSWDDRYNNANTKENARQMFTEYGAWGMIGVAGTQAANDSRVVTLDKGGVFLPSYSGAQSLRDPFVESVVNLRPSFYDEIKAIGLYAVNVHRWERGAMLRQSDYYGVDANDMFTTVADELGFTTTISSYNRVELDVSSALTEIMSTQPEFVILAAQLPAAVSFIRLAKAKHPDAETVFFCLSSVDTIELFSFLKSVGVDTTNVKATSGMPIFTNESLPLAAEFQASLVRYFPGQLATSHAWEGYINARFFIAAMTRTWELYTTTVAEDFLKTIYRVQPMWNISGLVIGPYTPFECDELLGPCGCNQGLHTVYILELSSTGELTETSHSRWDFRMCGTPSESSSKMLLIVVLAVVTGILVLASVAIVVTSVVCRRAHRQKDDGATGGTKYVHLESVSEVAGVPKPAQHPFYEAIAAEVMATTHFISSIEKEELRDMSLIGVGSSAKVYRATWRGTYVAVKQLHYQLDLCMDTMVSELANEIKLWSQLMHPYIVQFLGVTKELWLVMEFMEGGPLRTFIKNQHLPMRSKITLLQHAALALEYIHSLKIVHRDFNPNNIMVTGPREHLEAKLADFGLSRPELNASLRQTLSVGTPVYAAPEVLAHGQFSTKSDVYSFGLTLWFVETEEDPLANIRNQFELVRAVVMENKRPPISQCLVLPDLIEWCWNADPNERPTFDLITFTIHQYLRKTSTGGSDGGSLAIPPLSSRGSVCESPSTPGSYFAPALSSAHHYYSDPDTSDAAPDAAPSVTAVLAATAASSSSALPRQ